MIPDVDSDGDLVLERRQPGSPNSPHSEGLVLSDVHLECQATASQQALTTLTTDGARGRTCVCQGCAGAHSTPCT